MRITLFFGMVFLIVVGAYCQPVFDIVYLADPPVVCDVEWLHGMIEDWHATAINLRVSWKDIEDEKHHLDWTEVDHALRILDSAKLGIFIRVSMNVINPAWYGDFSVDDFHQMYDGSYYLNPYPALPDTSHRRMLNFTSRNSRFRQIAFFQRVVTHLKNSKFAKDVRLIVPTISIDDESEYPIHTLVNLKGVMTPTTMMSGYSRPERDAFFTFLKRKYPTIKNLDSAWGSTFSSFEQIPETMHTFGWHIQPNDPNYRFEFPNGRKDWLDFRTLQLKNFFDTLCIITKRTNKNFRFGLQFGSFYDELLPFRGFYDPTSLLEKVDFFVLGEVAEHRPNFDLSAVLCRSFARFWSWKNHRTGRNHIGFATETNWPGYGGDQLHPKGYTPQTLCRIWELQLKSYYDKGAAALFVSHWGTTDIALPNKFVDRVKSRYYMRSDEYLAWSGTLSHYSSQAPQQSIPWAVYLGCEQALNATDTGVVHRYTFGVQAGVDTGAAKESAGYRKLQYYEFPFTSFIAPEKKGVTDALQPEREYDVVTDHMIAMSPGYLASQFHELDLSRSRTYLTEQASRALRSPLLRGFQIRK